jgi:glycosyltransferase involved in cell wall biosynthesis
VLTSKLPTSLAIGGGSVLYLEGWVYHSGLRPLELSVWAGERREPVRATFQPTAEALRQRFPIVDARVADASTGFAALVPIQGPNRPSVLRLELELRCRGRGRPAVRTPLGSVDTRPREAAHRSGSDSRVAIALATFNPDVELFERQVASLVNQSHEDWVCIIADDGSEPEIAAVLEQTAGDRRFSFMRFERRLGFYRNFERALSFVPEEAAYVGLCDHDDYWHPDKIASLLDRFGPDTTLVFSDMNIATDRGDVISPTYWTTRANNYTDLTTLLLANTITGAASLFRASLLDDVLPFPPVVGTPYHDHWIACCALALGEIRYVDRPLYDYVQHSGNVIGHYAPERPAAGRSALLRALVRDALTVRRALLARWRAVYLWDVLRIESIALTLELRGGARLSTRKRRVLRRIARADRSWTTLFFLLLRGSKRVGRTRQTLGAEYTVAGGIAWRRLTWLKAKLRGSKRR